MADASVATMVVGVLLVLLKLGQQSMQLMFMAKPGPWQKHIYA
jgi:hypothetical protein